MSTALTVYRCGNDERLAAVRARPGLNGIEAVELLVPPGPLTALPRELLVRFVKPVAAVPQPASVQVVGGDALRPLSVVATSPTHDPRVVRVGLGAAGDLSEHQLRLVDPADPTRPPAGIDPVLARAVFSFGVVCQTELDCVDEPGCPPVARDEPLLDRLAKDYGGFRRVVLDRLSLLLPDWRQRNPADVRVALVELLAYVGDQLSYEQDAIATEAYLGTARKRISVRRHARLVDYRVHDGCSARTFVQLVIAQGAADVADGRREAAGGTFLTATPQSPPVLDATTPAGRDQLAAARRDGELVFEVAGDPLDPARTVAPATFSASHNRMTFHTWSGERCCLPAGATSATLAGHLPGLAAGDVVVLAEHRHPLTGSTADADPTHRHPVRLTRVDAGTGGGPLLDPATGDPVTEIGWDDADALPFTLIVSAETTEGAVTTAHDDVGVVLGNLVLVEHGERQRPEQPEVPAGPRPWRPVLATPHVTRSVPHPSPTDPVAAMRRTAPHNALAQVELTTTDGTWLSTHDLIGTGDSLRLVAEVDEDGHSHLRFGSPEPDGTFRHGRPPTPGASGAATATIEHRVGTGSIGNIGPGALTRTLRTGDARTSLSPVLLAAGVIDRVDNPLPAWGGADPEPIEEVRHRAPYAFQSQRLQQRAVTAADYARRAEDFADDGPDGDAVGVQRAVAQVRWTGSWYTVFVAVDRRGGRPVDDAFEHRLRRHLDRFRMAGHSIEIEAAADVPLELRLVVTVEPLVFRRDVLAEVLDVLSNRRLPDGRLGLFHPDRLTFAQTVYLSPALAAAQRIPGVVDVAVTRFGPYRQPAIERRDEGFLTVGRNEIPRLDNDPSRPERGVLGITLQGGR